MKLFKKGLFLSVVCCLWWLSVGHAAAAQPAADLGWAVPDFGRVVGLEAQTPWVFAAPGEGRPYYSWTAPAGGGWSVQLRSVDGAAATAVVLEVPLGGDLAHDTITGLTVALRRAGGFSEAAVHRVMAAAVASSEQAAGPFPRSTTLDGRTLVIRFPRKDDPRIVFAVAVEGQEGEFLRLPGDPVPTPDDSPPAAPRPPR